MSCRLFMVANRAWLLCCRSISTRVRRWLLTRDTRCDSESWRRVAHSQVLHQPAKTALRHVAAPQDHARRAIGMNREIGVHLGRATRHAGGQQAVVQQQLPHQRCSARLRVGNRPQVQTRQAVPRQASKPVLWHAVKRMGGPDIAQPLATQWGQKSPTDKFGVQFPSKLKLPEVHAEIALLGIGQRQVQIAQQRHQMGPALLTLSPIAHHHHTRYCQRCTQGLGRAGMHLVVQCPPLRMLVQSGLVVHGGFWGDCALEPVFTLKAVV